MREQIWFVGKGECKVSVKDKKGREIKVNTLKEGSHFGEINIIYNCPRSASVESLNYNTFSLIQKNLYIRLIQDYPEWEVCLKRHVISHYWDFRTKFIAEMIKRVEYFDLVPQDILYDLIFSLEIKIFDKDDVVLHTDEIIDSILFIEEGQIEVHTEFDGNKFTIDKLGPGSAINYRAVFLRD